MSVYSYFMILLATSMFPQGSNAIYDIARKGTTTEAMAVIKQFPEALNSVNADGFSPLILACYRGNNDVALWLIDRGANVNMMSPMGTALLAAVVKGNTPVAQKLLQRNADPNLTDKSGNTALIYAVKFQHADLVALLLQYKADKSLLDNMQKSAFEYATFSGNKSIIELLK